MARTPKWTIVEDEPSSPHVGLPSTPPSVRGLTTDQIRIVYQPIVDLEKGTIFACEALLRCSVPTFANPMTLFNQAVEEEACGRLGRIVREVTLIEAPRRVPLFVNIHPAELSARWLVRPDDPICQSENELYLEVTESATLEHFDLCVGVLKEVCARTGAHLVIDDLGAGHSNLKRLVDLSPSVVKLDRELIRELHRNRRQQVLVKHVVSLCVALGARVVAEGIETLDELKAVRDTGAHLGQGYFLARPSNPLPFVNWPF